MTRWIRFLVCLIGARFRPRLEVGGESRLRFRVWPTECDASYLNHAALLSLMECGRVDMMVRFGFLTLARRRGWYLPLATLAVRFDRPLRRLERFELRSRIVYWDEVAIWIEHRAMRGDRCVATAMVRNLVRSGRSPVPPDEILRALGREVPPRPARPPSVEAVESCHGTLAA
jgi:acyl-CoA thioesterase FadM